MPTEKQQTASRQNWSIYILLGFIRLMPHTKSSLTSSTYRAVLFILNTAIKEIKESQAKTNPKLRGR